MGRNSDLLKTTEIGTLALGATLVAVPRAFAKAAGFDAGEHKSAPELLRELGFWVTASGALLQYMDDDDERDRLLMACSAVGSASIVSGLVAAARGRVPWRAALLQTALVGTLVGVTCAYLDS